MAFFDIPEHWSNEQALAVYELLSQLQDRIWEYYEVRLVETLRGEIDGNLHDESVEASDFNDDLPF